MCDNALNEEKTVMDSNSVGRKKILLVEDEEIVRMVTSQMLGRLGGYDVLSVGSGKEALDVFRNDPDGFDLVLTDQMMPPGITGIELAGEIVKIRPDMPIILYSGFDLTEELPEKIIRGFILKPFYQNELAEKIKAIFANG